MENLKTELFDTNENKVLIEFAKLLNVTPIQIIAKNKIRHICDIRQLYCKLRYEVHGATYLEIAHEIDRDLTTVRKGLMRINNLLDVDNTKIVTMWNRVKDTPGFYH
jgi:chromosomal replication initiation ATPase DnaA